MTLSRRSLLGLSAALFTGVAAPLRAFAQEVEAAVPEGLASQTVAPGVLGGRTVTRSIMEAARMPSLSAAVARDGEVIWAEAFGFADMETRAPATSAGRYRLGSVSKVIAAATAARLAQRGEIDLDRPIGRYRPSLPTAHRQTTLRQLLAHTGGVRHYIGRDYDPKWPGGPIDYRKYLTTDDALAIFINDPLVSVPGEAFNYSTFGYTLMSAVLESATGKRFPNLVAAEVTRPLGLTTVSAERVGTTIPDRVRCYQAAHDTGVPMLAPLINPAYKWAGGGMLGAAPDVARFCAAFLKPGYLSSELLQQTFTPFPPTKVPAPVQVGIGWRIDKDRAGRVRHHHAGSIAGGRSIVMFLPETGLSVAILSNMGDLPVDPLTPAQQVLEGFLTV